MQPAAECQANLGSIGACVHLQDFFSKDCFKGHPKPYADFMEWRRKEDEGIEADRRKLLPGM